MERELIQIDAALRNHKYAIESIARRVVKESKFRNKDKWVNLVCFCTMSWGICKLAKEVSQLQDRIKVLEAGDKEC